ncbi:hypothetical protein JTE90_019294 [Oedothorax gibbosus]|uniref:Uncharacterized protein n=1 Tax=Oedothorax gibbosus TaxID=931172 RepID=A0AAV6UXF8_9ARAC|nr:hypothetical protein JTE90_019294 [Oedothorax gibbosus]
MSKTPPKILSEPNITTTLSPGEFFQKYGSYREKKSSQEDSIRSIILTTDRRVTRRVGFSWSKRVNGQVIKNFIGGKISRPKPGSCPLEISFAG